MIYIPVPVNGETQWVSVRNFTREEILKWLNLLKTQSTNHNGTRLRKLWKTHHPSIQGPWTPFTFRNPALNLAEFPNEELSRADEDNEINYKKILEMFEKQNIVDLSDKRAE